MIFLFLITLFTPPNYWKQAEISFLKANQNKSIEILSYTIDCNEIPAKICFIQFDKELNSKKIVLWEFDYDTKDWSPVIIKEWEESGIWQTYNAEEYINEYSDIQSFLNFWDWNTDIKSIICNEEVIKNHKFSSQDFSIN